ncbi:MAG TPA: hypothetical protein VG798_00365 [Rhizomicrobium sp.]|nr:hypothetical protein [Rhizomicrobium sp.]
MDGDIPDAAPDVWPPGYRPSLLERFMYPDRALSAPMRGLAGLPVNMGRVLPLLPQVWPTGSHQLPDAGLSLLSAQPQGGWQSHPFGPSITAKDGVPSPGPNIHALLACIAASTGAPFRVTSTSDGHSAGDPHTQDQAVGGTAAPMDRAALMQAAANCGAAYQQDEYVHPFKDSKGGHLHFQTRPGRGGATGPYFPEPVPGRRISK